MIKPVLTVLLATVLATPAVVQAQTTSDCSMAKFMAGHALTVIKGGASLEQTLGMFETNGYNSKIINEIYSRKDKLEQKKDAEMIGVNICMKSGAKV